jgi:hypothetical protein
MANKYRLDIVDAPNDGSGLVRYSIWALDAANNIIPGKHADFMIPVAEVAAAEALGTTALKNAAQKALLIQYAPPGWADAELSTTVTANAAATAAAATINARLTLPVSFTL